MIYADMVDLEDCSRAAIRGRRPESVRSPNSLASHLTSVHTLGHESMRRAVLYPGAFWFFPPHFHVRKRPSPSPGSITSSPRAFSPTTPWQQENTVVLTTVISSVPMVDGLWYVISILYVYSDGRSPNIVAIASRACMTGSYGMIFRISRLTGDRRACRVTPVMITPAPDVARCGPCAQT